MFKRSRVVRPGVEQILKWLRDPLALFLIGGSGIFFLAEFIASEEIPYHIEISAQDVQRLADQWAVQMRRPPDATERSGIIEQFIREEIYYREAKRLGLDANDTIVRRRLVQKLTFLTEDIATAAPLDQDALRNYYKTHSADYQAPEKISFKHRYFSSERRATARTDAYEALTDTHMNGDPFMLQHEHIRRSGREISDLFGAEFAATVMKLAPSDQWQGPLQSAYGWHAVLVTQKLPATLRPFEQVAARVSSDARQTLRKQTNEAYYADLKARYDIRYPSEY